MSAPANPNAFPSPDDDRPSDGYGMTLRDWFAGQAISAFLGSIPSEAVEDIVQGVRAGRPLAYGAYAIAGAMLAERAKVQA